MVRLKAKSTKKATGRFKISIPYGAIKSDYYWKFVDKGVKFQFLMVRLKAMACLIVQI